MMLLILGTQGCGSSKPADLPPLFPCKISVNQEEKPLIDATVRLVPSNGDMRFTVGGKTNTSGTAEIKTDGSWLGVPTGKYKVCISKLVVPDLSDFKEIPTDPKEYEKYTQELQKRSKETVSVVDPKYHSPKTTPFEIEVTEKGGKETFDVGTTVNKSLDSVAPSSSSNKKR
jgi:hypothetical protein